MTGVGLAGMLGKSYIGVSLPETFTEIPIPLLSKIPVIGDILFNRDPLFYIVYYHNKFWLGLFSSKLVGA